jgi:FdhE protein
MEAETIQRAIDAIKKDRPGYEHILDLYGKIMIKQSEFLGRTKVEPVIIAKDAALARLKRGTPLLGREDFRVDVSSASQLFRRLCDILKSESEKSSDEIGKIESSLEKGALILEEVFQSALADGSRISELAEELSLDRDITLLLVTASIKPSLEAVASYVREVVEDASWSGHCCPVCGSSQAISELRESRQASVESTITEVAERVLHCSFCGNEWQTARLGCTFCGNTDTESLRYLYAEGENGYRIDTCEKCKKYIKTVDSKEISREIVPTVEDIATLHLDIIAEQEGYKREAWFLMFSFPSGELQW